MVGSHARLCLLLLIPTVIGAACSDRDTDAVPPTTTVNLSSPEVTQRLLSACSDLVTDWLDDRYTSAGFGSPTPERVPDGYSFLVGDTQDLSDANPSMILECGVMAADQSASGPLPIVVISTTGQPLVVAVPD